MSEHGNRTTLGSSVVDVESSLCTLSRPSEKRISMVSFRMGSKPPWWIPIPLFRSGRTCSTWRLHTHVKKKEKKKSRLPGRNRQQSVENVINSWTASWPRLHLSTNDYITAAGSHKVTQQKRRRTTGGVLEPLLTRPCSHLHPRFVGWSGGERPPHLRELLIFIREAVHRVVEHLLHQTLLIICNTHLQKSEP